MKQLPDFRPVAEIREDGKVRRDYERLRLVVDFVGHIGANPAAIEHITIALLDYVFELLQPDRVRLFLQHSSSDDELNQFQLRYVKTREGLSDDIPVPDDVIDKAVKDQAGCLRLLPDTIMATPIHFGVECLGLLIIQSDKPGAFDDKDQLACVRLSGLYGLAIQNARLATAVEAMRRELNPAMKPN